MSDEDSDEPQRKKVLPQRNARGVRISTLHKEGDDDFWKQDFWQEGESDDDYSEEEEEEDVVDSDFFDEEDVSDEDEVKVEKEKDGNKKNVYTDKAKVTKKKIPPPKAVPAVSSPPAPSRSAARKRKAASPDASLILSDYRIPGTLRSSARAATQENSNAVKQNIIAREGKAVKARAKVEHKHWTQAERLAEAARTELINRKSLEDLLRLEELNKKKALPVRVFPTGPRVLFHDKRGKSFIGFVEMDAPDSKGANGWPAIFKSVSVSPPPRDVCAITHHPARYKDPLTGIPYSSLEAFRLIRELCPPMDDDDKPLLVLKKSLSNSAGLNNSSSCGSCGSGSNSATCSSSVPSCNNSSNSGNNNNVCSSSSSGVASNVVNNSRNISGVSGSSHKSSSNKIEPSSAGSMLTDPFPQPLPPLNTSEHHLQQLHLLQQQHQQQQQHQHHQQHQQHLPQHSPQHQHQQQLHHTQHHPQHHPQHLHAPPQHQHAHPHVQQQHMQLQASPHQHHHPFDPQNPTGANSHDLSAMQMQYSYAPYSQPYYKDVSYQSSNNPGLAQYHPDYQLQLQLQQMQSYPQ